MPPLPFSLSTLLRPLSPPLARTRLKSNIFALFLFSLRSLLPFYRALRAGIVLGCDKLQGRVGREASWGEAGVGLGEILIYAVLVWNIIEATVALQYPSTYVPPQPKGMQITPSKASSPLTRAYSPTKAAQGSTPTPTPLSRSLYRPGAAPAGPSTPSRAPAGPANALTSSTSQPHPLSNSTSSLSSSTAKILNIQGGSPVKGNGLFYEPRVAGGGGVGGGGFVPVDRDEREWTDNVWKGVRGKGGKVGV
ncbi:hypothetical protein IAT38_006168 [Cryptococcus sp. DSM 104549]